MENPERRRGSSGALFTSRKCPPGPGLESTCQLPLGMLYSPFGDHDDATSTTTRSSLIGKNKNNDESSSLPPIICLTCCSYINLYCTILDDTWQCALCGARNVAEATLLQSNDAVLVAPLYEFQQPLVPVPSSSATTPIGDSVTIVLVVDANLPAGELQSIGRAVADLPLDVFGESEDKTTTTIQWGLVVYDEAVAVYQLGLDSGIAAADVLLSHHELTDELLQTQAYLGQSTTRSNNESDNDVLHRIQTCLAAVAANHEDEQEENIIPPQNTNTEATTPKPLSRLEKLKRAKAERQARAAAAAAGAGGRTTSMTATDTPASTATITNNMPAQSPWLRLRRSRESSSAYRCTGEAMQVAMDLATASHQQDSPSPSRTARVWCFTNGCPNLGDGSVVVENASSNNTDDKNGPDNAATGQSKSIDAAQMARAVEFYKILAQTAVEEGLAVDVFLSGVAELGLAAYQALVGPSAGYALVHESFVTPHLARHLQYIWEYTFVSHLPSSLSSPKQMAEGCMVDVRFSSFLTPTHFCGPGDLVRDEEKNLLINERSAFAAGAALAAKKNMKTNDLPSRDMLETSLTRFRVGRVDPMSTYSLMFQLNDFFQKDNFALFQCVARHLNRSGTHYVTRVTTHRLPLAKDVGEFLDAVDEEVIPVVLAKEAVYRSMHGREVEGQSNDAPSEEQLELLAYATQLDLDATVARVSHAYRLLGLQEGRRGLDLTEEGGVRAAGSSLDFAFPPELGEALKRLYHLRRGPFLSPGPMRSTDDRLQLRTLFLRFPLEESLLAMAPSLWALFDPAGPINPVPPETLALWDSAVIAGDNFHSLFVWCGKKTLNAERAKESCQLFLGERADQRFPMPDMHILHDGDSMSRRFTALLSPSHGDPIEHSLAHFPGLNNLPPDELTSLRSRFQFYDASTDPSFRSWFWTISSATSKSKDEGWSLCE